MKRLVIISDLHCGHRAGLTPPGWQYQENQDDHERDVFGQWQRATWDFYSEWMLKLQPIDLLVVNGDAIDGKGERSGGTEQQEADRNKQVSIAAHCIEQANARAIIIIYGTPYHTGKEEDFELQLAQKVKAVWISGHEWLDVNGVIFDFKHFISGSVVPYGRLTSIQRDAMWNKLWSIDELQPLAHVVVRSHVHYFKYGGDKKTLTITTPGLQGYGSKYGVRFCSGLVDIGFIHFDIDDDGGYTWEHHLLEGEFLKAHALKASDLISPQTSSEVVKCL